MLTYTQDPIGVMERFLSRVSPFDPDPQGRPAATIELNNGHRKASFQLTGHACLALQEALARYTDPNDRGRCDSCGCRRLDDHLGCLDCGHINGIFGEVLRQQVEAASREPAVS